MSCHGKPMTCGHVPTEFADEHGQLAHPLPRLAILPGDPRPLRRELARLLSAESAAAMPPGDPQ